jgi:hypothetical protein
MFDAIDAHPWVGSALTRAPGQLPMVRILERIGRQVRALGVPDEEQWATVGALLNYILGVGGQNAANAADARDHVPQTSRAEFLGAVSDGNGQRACAQLSDGAQQALEQDESKPCPEAVRELDDEIQPSAVTRAQVFVTTAKVDLADGQSAFLELTTRGWRVAAAGCRPTGPDEPYQCVLEA